MNIQLRIDCTNATHTHFTVFLDDVYCGQLCVKNEEFDHFADIIESGVRLQPKVNLGTYSFDRVGNTWNEVQQARAALMGERQ